MTGSERAGTDDVQRAGVDAPRVAVVVGNTHTAAIDGISAAGADPDLRVHTPAADAEIVAYGAPVAAPAVPVSPTGCPTPALVTRAVRDLVGFDLLAIEAGLDAETAAPTVLAGVRPGADVRTVEPVPDAGGVFERGRELAAGLPDDELVVGESIPGGTTTALGVLRALGEPHDVSSSLPENPLDQKRAVVSSALDASDIEAGDAAEPLRAVRLAGDPVLAAVAGLVVGALETGTAVTLAGGTQMVAAAALVRHRDVDGSLELATTSFVDEDPSTDLRAAATDLDLSLTVTDPGFDEVDHVALERYRAGEAKEGVAMGGALALADRAGVSMAAVREQLIRRYDALVGDDGP